MHLKLEDVVITFNYDLTIEKAIELRGDLDWEFYWPNRTRDAITLLKLHGSIDWFKTEDLYAVPSSEKTPLDPGIGRISYLKWWDYTELPRREITPYIIPPTYFKNIQDEELRKVWASVIPALGKADSIFILGYSLPDADPQARIALRSGLELYIERRRRQGKSKAAILVADPDPNVKAKFDGLGLEFTFRASKFEGLDFGRLLKSS